MLYDIAIIGGGASGMMASISASLANDLKVVILEKNDSLGCKLLITGQGRCNITNSNSIKETLKKYSKDEAKFLKHSFYNLNNEELLDIFRTKGLEFKEEENRRIVLSPPENLLSLRGVQLILLQVQLVMVVKLLKN